MLRDITRNLECNNCCTESHTSLFLELKAKTKSQESKITLRHRSSSSVQISVQSYTRKRIVYCSMSAALLPFSKHVESV